MSKLILGTGGSTPTVISICSNDIEVVNIVAMEKGNSVYAIDTDNSLVAIGTRCGKIELLKLSENGTKSFDAVATMFQGEPILSVCLGGDNQLVSSDTAGRCLLWQFISNPDKPQMLEADGGRICSLLKIADNTVVGLSDSGKLLFWDITTAKLTRTVDCPSPYGKLALVHLRHWLGQNALVYPAADGELISCSLKDYTIRVFKAHQGTFYAVIAGDKHIYTIGAEDGLMKRWCSFEGTLQQCYNVPKDIVAAELLDDPEDRFVLINSAGKAAVFTTESDRLNMDKHLNGESFRVIAGPSPIQKRVTKHQRRIEKAAELRIVIEDKITNNQLEGIDKLYLQLTDLGFECISLALRARQAAGQKNIADEFNARHQLASILPQDDPKALPYWRLYMNILKETCHFAEAARVYKTVMPTVNENNLCQLNDKAGILATDNWIIETVVPIHQLIKIATIMKRPLVGRWVLGSMHNMPLPGGGFSSQMLVDIYERTRVKNKLENLPSAMASNLYWISQNPTIQAETVVFDDISILQKPRLCRAIRIYADRETAFFTPVVFFDSGKCSTNQSYKEHNHNLFLCYEQIINQKLSDRWPETIFRVVNSAIRQITTDMHKTISC